MRREVYTVRDRLWLLAHDDRYTPLQPLIDTRALNVGVVAAVVIDLLLADRIRISAGRIHLNDDEGRGHPVDPISTAVLAAVDNDNPLRLADVLASARADGIGVELNPFQDGYQRTQAGLIAAGLIREERRRIRANVYHLVDPNLISRIRSAVNHRLVYAHRKSPLDLDCLCAMLLATGLYRSIATPFGPKEAEPILRALVDEITFWAGEKSPLAAVPHVVKSVEETIGDLATAPF